MDTETGGHIMSRLMSRGVKILVQSNTFLPCGVSLSRATPSPQAGPEKPSQGPNLSLDTVAGGPVPNEGISLAPFSRQW